ncbi:polyprenol monophosphomannose synthase [Brevibacterium daeguense]|uniref:Polyprenol monophosphomannose synthase n=1 Tax=Brevibacterium daeguense TaxID=909936 RepID=A0ABP8ENQ2_9MICO|nr:polyprenol monophosphomannose synthase [Brevibacterium daeguense]
MNTLVIIPTYNERDSLPKTIEAVHRWTAHAHILVVDDSSPDGTGEWAAELAARDERVFVLHRTAKNGLGAAYVAGFGWALGRDYTIICEMDADGSHRGRDLPQLLAAVEEGADLAIGSRWISGGAVVNWPRNRHLLSRGANVYVSAALGLGVKDATAGFRAYRREALAAIDLDDIESLGYCFQIDMTKRILDAGFSIAEVPITFVERELGESKMSGRIIKEAMMRVTSWGLEHRAQQVRSLVGRG